MLRLPTLRRTCAIPLCGGSTAPQLWSRNDQLHPDGAKVIRSVCRIWDQRYPITRSCRAASGDVEDDPVDAMRVVDDATRLRKSNGMGIVAVVPSLEKWPQRLARQLWVTIGLSRSAHCRSALRPTAVDARPNGRFELYSGRAEASSERQSLARSGPHASERSARSYGVASYLRQADRGSQGRQPPA
jgi:hypothetical protein